MVLYRLYTLTKLPTIRYALNWGACMICMMIAEYTYIFRYLAHDPFHHQPTLSQPILMPYYLSQPILMPYYYARYGILLTHLYALNFPGDFPLNLIFKMTYLRECKT